MVYKKIDIVCWRYFFRDVPSEQGITNQLPLPFFHCNKHIKKDLSILLTFL